MVRSGQLKGHTAGVSLITVARPCQPEDLLLTQGTNAPHLHFLPPNCLPSPSPPQALAYLLHCPLGGAQHEDHVRKHAAAELLLHAGDGFLHAVLAGLDL